MLCRPVLKHKQAQLGHCAKSGARVGACVLALMLGEGRKGAPHPSQHEGPLLAAASGGLAILDSAVPPTCHVQQPPPHYLSRTGAAIFSVGVKSK